MRRTRFDLAWLSLVLASCALEWSEPARLDRGAPDATPDAGPEVGNEQQAEPEAEPVALQDAAPAPDSTRVDAGERGLLDAGQPDGAAVLDAAGAGPPRATPEAGPCSGATCDANAECVGSGAARACRCKPGYTGAGTSCQNLDECASKLASCPSFSTCEDTNGSYVCRCTKLPNALSDGDFEAQLSTRIGAPWRRNDEPDATSGDVTIVSGAGQVRGGTRAVLCSGKKIYDKTWHGIAQTVTVARDTVYRASAWVVSSSNLYEGYFSVRAGGTTKIHAEAGFGKRHMFDVSRGYHEVTFTFDSGQLTTLELVIGVFAPDVEQSWLRIDDVTLSRDLPRVDASGSTCEP